MSDLYYEDGTLYDPPENPLKAKWAEKYPAQKDTVMLDENLKVKWENGEPVRAIHYCPPGGSYSCMYCDKCPHGDYWKVPDEDKDVWDKYQNDLKEYDKSNKIHGELLIPINFTADEIATLNKVKINFNKNMKRTLHISRKFIPKESEKLFFKELCRGCIYENAEESLNCNYCQDGSHYEEQKEEVPG